LTSAPSSHSPAEINLGESISIDVLVTNTGDLASSYSIVVKLDGVMADDLGSGNSQMVSFELSLDTERKYAVDVNGLTGSFIVKPPNVTGEVADACDTGHNPRRTTE
jgi:hypothetical protein